MRQGGLGNPFPTRLTCFTRPGLVVFSGNARTGRRSAGLLKRGVLAWLPPVPDELALQAHTPFEKGSCSVKLFETLRSIRVGHGERIARALLVAADLQELRRRHPVIGDPHHVLESVNRLTLSRQRSAISERRFHMYRKLTADNWELFPCGDVSVGYG